MAWQTLFPHPIIQGPMAGGANTPAMVAAVSNAGALGSIGASLLPLETLRSQVEQVRQLTGKPFLLNFFVQKTLPAPTDEELARAAGYLRPVLDTLGWESLPKPAKWCENFEEQFEEILKLRPAIASFSFDILSAAQVERLHAAGIYVFGTITTVEEAQAWEAIGADAVIASGAEAGGHRSYFIGPMQQISAVDLLRDVVAAVKVPVISAGNIMNGADIRERLALGAAAVQMGTAFLVCDETGIHPTYKQSLVEAGPAAETRLTRGFSGRYARGLVNRFMQQMEDVQELVPAYPVQNALTTPIRGEGARREDKELMSLWCGSGVARVRPMPAAKLVALLVEEMKA